MYSAVDEAVCWVEKKGGGGGAADRDASGKRRPFIYREGAQRGQRGGVGWKPDPCEARMSQWMKAGWIEHATRTGGRERSGQAVSG